ncbi:MAG: PepSY-associated TM helix domain-containing protein [Arcticibacter sp.]
MVRITSAKLIKKKRSVFYRISAWLHLWLGLISGIVVVIVSLTGAALTFEEEWRYLFQPYQHAESQGRSFLPPSVLADSVKKAYHLPGVSAVMYRGKDRSAVVPWYRDRANLLVNYVDPYTGKALYSQRLNDDFFRIMIVGHYELWLPRKIGKPIVAYSTLIFVITLITGMVLWWPKKWTKRSRNQSFLIRFKASFKRLNYDLHNVLGFYSLVVALVLALTGIVYGMEWFNNAVYWTASGGKKAEFTRVMSDTTLTPLNDQVEEDLLYARLQKTQVNLEDEHATIGYPRGESGTWTLTVNPKPGTRYLETTQQFEQHSLKLLQADIPYARANGGEQAMRINYDLHVGSIGGITTKIIAFLVCMISASLPITGLIIWLGKKKKAKEKAVS